MELKAGHMLQWHWFTGDPTPLAHNNVKILHFGEVGLKNFVTMCAQTWCNQAVRNLKMQGICQEIIMIRISSSHYECY